MDWQVIILTLGASLITGAVSLIGNIIITRANIKKSIIENSEKNRSEFMHIRFQTYDEILKCINNIECNINKENILEKSELKTKWLGSYQYCSKTLNQLIRQLIISLEKINIYKNTKTAECWIERIRMYIKADLDSYYGNKEKRDISWFR